MNTAVRTLRIDTLIAGMGAQVPAEAAALPVADLCLDSRRVSPGALFVALEGAEHDGHAYLDQAAQAGAVAALGSRACPGAALPVIVVPELRQRLGEVAARFFGHPGRSLNVSAVTGTNGKTTVSQLLAQLIRAAGYACGTIGTLGASTDAAVHESLHTTPDPIALQRVLADWVCEALPFVAMEASSHALDQGRLSGLEVDTAIFTNLTRDHLDYHGSMEAYGAAKARLFAMPGLGTAILNADDPFSASLRAQAPAPVEVVTYALNSAAADVRGSRLEVLDKGLRFRLETPWGEGTVRCPLLGAFNGANVLAALTGALVAGLPFSTVVAAAEYLDAVRGRMQPLRVKGGPLVVVDFAHTPDALREVLQTLRGLCRGRLIVVFGCGGDRDRGKRPLMAEAVSASADFAIITSDNPRREDPAAIIADIETGMRGAYTTQVDRAEAIALAIREATARDCVLIAGKGHETYQVQGTQRFPFDDAAVARSCLEGLAA